MIWVWYEYDDRMRNMYMIGPYRNQLRKKSVSIKKFRVLRNLVELYLYRSAPSGVFYFIRTFEVFVEKEKKKKTRHNCIPKKYIYTMYIALTV